MPPGLPPSRLSQCGYICRFARPGSFCDQSFEQVRGFTGDPRQNVKAGTVQGGVGCQRYLDQALALKAALECGSVITCEEHSVTGGLGEAVCGLLSERHPTPVYRPGIQDSRSSGAEEPMKKLAAEDIVSAAKKALTRK